MKLAVIDIGSNAIRLQIVKVFEETNLISFKKIEYLRFPLRLGQDVFNNGKIGERTSEKFEKLMHTFKLLIELYDADSYSAVATSAMREAKNGNEIRNYICDSTGLEIDIISGSIEARILNKSILPFLEDKQYVHIDVGGGSTELNIYNGKSLTCSESFKVGSVRKLSLRKRNDVFRKMNKWIQKSDLSNLNTVTGIGTGGNINKLFKLSNRNIGNHISLLELKALRAYVKEFSVKERMSILKMNPDRADVIIPASDIYIDILENVGSDQILVPKVGLKDGMVYELYEKVSKKSLSQIEYIEEF